MFSNLPDPFSLSAVSHLEITSQSWNMIKINNKVRKKAKRSPVERFIIPHAAEKVPILFSHFYFRIQNVKNVSKYYLIKHKDFTIWLQYPLKNIKVLSIHTFALWLRQCSKSFSMGSSENKANPDWWTSRQPISWFSDIKNSSMVVDPSNPMTWGLSRSSTCRLKLIQT